MLPGTLAQALGRAGQISEGLAAIEEALAWTERTEERWRIAELLRIKGELVLLQGAPEAATGQCGATGSVGRVARVKELNASVADPADAGAYRAATGHGDLWGPFTAYALLSRRRGQRIPTIWRPKDASPKYEQLAFLLQFLSRYLGEKCLFWTGANCSNGPRGAFGSTARLPFGP